MRALTVLNMLIWVAFTWHGFQLVDGVAAQNVPGFPNNGQVTLYICVPLLMAASALCMYGLFRFTQLKRTALVLQAVLLISVLPFLLIYTGGV